LCTIPVEEGVDWTLWREGGAELLIERIDHVISWRAFARQHVRELVGRHHVAGGFGSEEVRDLLIEVIAGRA
jgi:hypothetical protein